MLILAVRTRVLEKPFNGLGRRLVVDAEPPSDGKVAHSKPLKL